METIGGGELMKQCYLCESNSYIEKTYDGFSVQCSGPCGPYMITHMALQDLDKIPGRKQGVIDRIRYRRQQDQTRWIRISHDSVDWK